MSSLRCLRHNFSPLAIGAQNCFLRRCRPVLCYWGNWQRPPCAPTRERRTCIQRPLKMLEAGRGLQNALTLHAQHGWACTIEEHANPQSHESSKPEARSISVLTLWWNLERWPIDRGINIIFDLASGCRGMCMRKCGERKCGWCTGITNSFCTK
jgi:hypothetical protein